MRTLITCSLALLAAAPAARAQAPADTATTYKHQLGLTASPVLDGFFRNNRSLPLGLLYKRQVRPNQAVRLRLVGQYSRRDTTDFIGALKGSGTRAWDAMVFGGYEWQNTLGNRFGWYYGAEVGTGWGRSEIRDVREVTNTNGVGTYAYDSRYVIRRWQLQVRPFVGVRFRAAARVDVFAESALAVVYERRRDNLDNVVTRQNTDGTLVNGYAFYTSRGLNINLRPIQLIGFSYKF